MTTMVEKVALAIRDEAVKFKRPVQFYVEGEALSRYEQEHGLDAAWDAEESGKDFELESWAILARAAIEAMAAPTPRMCKAACAAMSPGKRPTPNRVSHKAKHAIRYRAMIQAALEEKQ